MNEEIVDSVSKLLGFDNFFSLKLLKANIDQMYKIYKIGSFKEVWRCHKTNKTLNFSTLRLKVCRTGNLKTIKVASRSFCFLNFFNRQLILWSDKAPKNCRFPKSQVPLQTLSSLWIIHPLRPWATVQKPIRPSINHKFNKFHKWKIHESKEIFKQKCCEDLITRKQKIYATHNCCSTSSLLFSFPFSSTCSYVFRFILKIQFSSTFTKGNFIQTFLFHFLKHVKQEIRLNFTWKTFSSRSNARGRRIMKMFLILTWKCNRTVKSARKYLLSLSSSVMEW